MKFKFIIALLSLSFVVSADETTKTVGDNTYRWAKKSYSVNEVLVFRSSKSQTDTCWSEERASLKGFVGNMITLNIFGSQHCEGMARLNHWEKINTFRVIDGKVEKVTLLDFFSHDDLVEVLSMDSYLQRKYSGNIKKNVRDALFDRGNERCEEVSSNTLDHFAFHHLRADKVAIRLFLKKCNSSNRALQLGFYITPDQQLLNLLKLSERNGLLMQHLN